MQVEDLRKQHAANRALDQALAALYQRMYETELHFLSRTEMHSDDKWYVEKYKLYMNLVWLLAEIGGSGGDVAGGAAYRSDQRCRRRVQGPAGGARGCAKGLRPPAEGGRGVQQDARGSRGADHRSDVGTVHRPLAMCFLTLPVRLSDSQTASLTRYADSARESGDHWIDPA